MKSGAGTLGADLLTTSTGTVQREGATVDRCMARFGRSVDWIFAAALIALGAQLVSLMPIR